MKSLIDLEKKINSELTTKINKTNIKHSQIYIEIDKDDLIDVLLFVKTNKDAKDWFLQIETFDPHEPFFAPDRFKEKFKTGYNGPRLDWPQYDRVKETPSEVDELKSNYLAL